MKSRQPNLTAPSVLLKNPITFSYSTPLLFQISLTFSKALIISSSFLVTLSRYPGQQILGENRSHQMGNYSTAQYWNCTCICNHLSFIFSNSRESINFSGQSHLHSDSIWPHPHGKISLFTVCSTTCIFILVYTVILPSTYKNTHLSLNLTLFNSSYCPIFILPIHGTPCLESCLYLLVLFFHLHYITMIKAECNNYHKVIQKGSY